LIKNLKVGVLLAGIGAIIGIIVVLMVVVLPMFKEALVGHLNVRLPAFISFVLNFGEKIQLHLVSAECISLILFIAGLVTIHCAGLRQCNSPN
jgi:type II secretory pathway component PulF